MFKFKFMQILFGLSIIHFHSTIRIVPYYVSEGKVSKICCIGM